MNNILSKFGVSAATLSSQGSFKPPKHNNNVLLYDGDGACYTHTNGVAKVETAFRRFETDIYEHMFLAGCTSARVHLTPRGCLKAGRHLLKTVKPYQANRTGVQKPPLLEVLRGIAEQHFQGHPDIEVISHLDIEADDGLMIDAYNMRNGVMISPDKDLRINPFASYDVDAGRIETLVQGDRYGWIERKHWLTPSGRTASKMVGKGTKFFFAQMLMGDTADNVQGILKLNGKLCGEAGTYAALKDVHDENECCNIVLDGYREINQNVIAEGAAMWLLRSYDDSVYKFLSEHDLSPQNKQFLEDSYNGDWKHVEH